MRWKTRIGRRRAERELDEELQAHLDMETARNLGIAINAPTAEARCVTVDSSGMVVYVGEITYPGDCVRLNIELIGQNRS